MAASRRRICHIVFLRLTNISQIADEIPLKDKLVGCRIVLDEIMLQCSLHQLVDLRL